MRNVNEKKNSPYQRLKTSTAGQFVRENQILSAGGAVGSAIVIAGGAAASQTFRRIAEKGIVPLAGTAISGYGAALAHDAFVNDARNNRPLAAGKGLLGTVMALGGAEVVGKSYDIPVLDEALSGPFRFLGRHYKATGTVLGAGAIVAGGASVYSGVKNDLGKSKLEAAAKIVGGAALGMGGLETIGQIHNIPVLQPYTFLGKRIGSVAGVGVTAGGVGAGTFAVNRIKKAAAGENVAINGALGVASGLTSAAAVLGGVELVGRDLEIPLANEALTGTVKAIAKNGVGSTVAGTLLVGGAGVLGYEAIKNIKKDGNPILTATEGMAATVAAAGGLQLVGHGLGIKALKGLLTEHAGIAGGTAVSAIGASFAKVGVDDVRKNGLNPLNTLAMTLGAAAVPTGITIGAASVDADKVAELSGRGALAVVGVGAGAISYLSGRAAVSNFKKGEQLKGVGYSALTLGTAVGSATALGHAFNIKPLQMAGNHLWTYALKPIGERVIEPAATYLYKHPLAGAAIVGGAMAAGGGYWYYNKKQGEKQVAAKTK